MNRLRCFAFLDIATLPMVLSLGVAIPADAAVTIESYQNIAPDVFIRHPPSPPEHDPSTAGSPHLLAASSTDLVEGQLARVAYIFGENVPAVYAAPTTSEFAGGEATWTDGSIVTFHAHFSSPDWVIHAPYGVVSGRLPPYQAETLVTFDLQEVYDLSQIDVYLGWVDAGRDDSSFNVLVSNDDINYTQISAHLRGPENTFDYDTAITNLFRTIDNGEGPTTIATARYVQLHFYDADNSYAGLVEVDIFGSRAVPEPSGIFLAGIGIAGILWHRTHSMHHWTQVNSVGRTN